MLNLLFIKLFVYVTCLMNYLKLKHILSCVIVWLLIIVIVIQNFLTLYLLRSNRFGENKDLFPWSLYSYLLIILWFTLLRFNLYWERSNII